MKNNNRSVQAIDLVQTIPASELANTISFSYPQSNLLFLGDTDEIPDVGNLFNEIIIQQFEFSIYICEDPLPIKVAKPLLKTGCYLHKVSPKDVSKEQQDTDTLIDLFQKNKRIVLSLKGVSESLRLEYWNFLNVCIRNYFIQNKVQNIPYMMIWLDNSLTLKNPQLFEQFRILSLWGDDYGLRFSLSLNSLSSLTSPARTIFNIVVLFPQLPNNEVTDILHSLPISDKKRNQLFKQFYGLNPEQLLIVSPSNMFEPFMLQL
jgi:hypothetical protein